MASENVERMLAGLEAMNRGDKAMFVDSCDPEVTNDPPREWPESRRTTGAEDVWAFLRAASDTWDERKFEAVPIAEGPDAVVAAVEAEMRASASGAVVQWSYFVVTRHRAGRVAAIAWFADRDEALKVAGTAEKPEVP
jgi:ketosteroid isomerase-like protein